MDIENTKKVKKIDITFLEIYYFLVIIFNFLNYEIRFSNEFLGILLVILVHCIIVYISLNKINENNIGRIIILGFILYIVNCYRDINILFKFILLISNIVIYYLKRSKTEEKNINVHISFRKEDNLKTLVRIMIFLSVCCFIKIVFWEYLPKYNYVQYSPNEKYEVCIAEIPTGAWSSFRHNICLYENKYNFNSVKFQKKLHNKVLASSSGEIIVKWEDNQKFSFWEICGFEGVMSSEYICEYTIDSFINSDTFINARNKEFIEKMEKMKTVEDLSKEEIERLKTIEDLYYEENKVEEFKLGDEVNSTGFWHNEAHIWIINSKKELLIQREKETKDVYINKPYISIKINPINGENEKDVIKKELEKVIGVEIDENKLKHLFSLQNNDNGSLDYGIYLLEMDLDIDKLQLQEDEISEVENIYYKNLAMMIKNEDTVNILEECKIMLAIIDQKYGD